ncbi:hypothetical protein [Pedobacter sp. MC2016-24]|uniref:hypothetical protein n=1 Tax=Pedobacter sp. MC2016-24 TaxID=2780090 RepID=UPI00187DE961|nr:hypothetical protein [Pedobacter sp. MC2016-24]MBE9602563.1 hypothetical protein [Pedobacter sp. MC2016-24]
MKKSTFQKNIILSLAVLTAIVSMMILITGGAEMNLALTSILYMAATFSLGTVGLISLMPPAKKLQPIRVKK